MVDITATQLDQLLKWDQLIERIRDAFANHVELPARHHHQYPNPSEGNESTLLLMPAWDDGRYLGVKVVNVAPNNSKYDLPSIHGVYLLFDLKTGRPIASLDAQKLTTKRTAATSGLVSSMLSRTDSKSLFMIGTGALAPELIQAHAAVRPIEKVYLWGRTAQNTNALEERIAKIGFQVQVVEEVSEGMQKADIVSCATLSETPLVLGCDCRPGQHIDLVGSYLPHTREADDELVRKASMYLDTTEAATRETGDIAIPLKNGTLKQEDIKADLYKLSAGSGPWRADDQEITCFKSVGHAIEDLAAAGLAYEMIR